VGGLHSEYMLLLSGTPGEDESELLGPQAELRKKALEHADVRYKRSIKLGYI
jgi:hypothetical protein